MQLIFFIVTPIHNRESIMIDLKWLGDISLLITLHELNPQNNIE